MSTNERELARLLQKDDGRKQRDDRGQWWRLVRDRGTGVERIESITDRSLLRGLDWAHATEVNTVLGTGPTTKRAVEELRKCVESYLGVSIAVAS